MLSTVWNDGKWFNPPPHWSATADGLRVTVAGGTDFWNQTHYGYSHDSGHFLGFAAPDAFTAEVRVRAKFAALYDQAGLMIRSDTAHWVKLGIERWRDRTIVGSVVTNAFSDWAIGGVAGSWEDIRLRATLRGSALELSYAAGDDSWSVLRLAPFAGATRDIGPMCCSPTGSGFEAMFDEFRLGSPDGIEG